MNENFRVFVPARISGFFEILARKEKSTNIMYGSRGAGPNIQLGGRTNIKILDDEAGKISIFINGRKENNALTSINVIKKLLPVDFGASIEVYHELDVPIGCGYGSSGIGALGLSAALNLALNLNLTLNQVGAIAHEAEIISKTGLGTVGPQIIGGLTITRRGGPPGKNLIDRIMVPPDHIVVSGTFGPIKTKKILCDESLFSAININGKRCMKKLISSPSVNNFLSVSRDFAAAVDLLTPRVREVLRELDKIHVTSSMSFVGETVFTIIKEELKKPVLEVLESFFSNKQIYSAEISNSGITILRG